MTYTINQLNYPLYLNLSGGDRVVTVAVSGATTIEVKAPNRASIQRHAVTGNGQMIALRVPAQHFVEIDGPTAGVQVEIQGTA
jgi:hypothetical protein